MKNWLFVVVLCVVGVVSLIAFIGVLVTIFNHATTGEVEGVSFKIDAVIKENETLRNMVCALDDKFEALANTKVTVTEVKKVTVNSGRPIPPKAGVVYSIVACDDEGKFIMALPAARTTPDGKYYQYEGEGGYATPYDYHCEGRIPFALLLQDVVWPPKQLDQLRSGVTFVVAKDDYGEKVASIVTVPPLGTPEEETKKQLWW